MGYGYYTLPDGREAGYGVEAECDREGCAAKIDRGLGYLCGDSPDGHRGEDEPGCGRYFCGAHQGDHDCPNRYGDRCHDCEGDTYLTRYDGGAFTREQCERCNATGKEAACEHCGERIEKLDDEHSTWWVHEHHPSDDHDAEPRKVGT